MSVPLDEQIESTEKLNLGTLLLLDSFQRAGREIDKQSKATTSMHEAVLVVNSSLKTLGHALGFLATDIVRKFLGPIAADPMKNTMDMFNAILGGLDPLDEDTIIDVSSAFKMVSTTVRDYWKKSKMAGRAEDLALKESWKAINEYKAVSKTIAAVNTSIMNQKVVGEIRPELEKELDESLERYRDSLRTLISMRELHEKARSDLAGAIKRDVGKFFMRGLHAMGTAMTKLGTGVLEVGGGIKSGMLSPLKAIPLQIGTLLIKPFTRLLDPFFETLEMLTLITEPFVGLLEIFFAPLQQVIGIIAGDLAQSLLGNEDMIRDVTTAGQSLANVFLLTWNMFKPLLPLLVDGMRVFAQLITALAPLLQLLLLPLQALGAWLSSFMPSASSTTYNSTSINVSGSVITERQLQRTAMEGVM